MMPHPVKPRRQLTSEIVLCINRQPCSGAQHVNWSTGPYPQSPIRDAMPGGQPSILNFTPPCPNIQCPLPLLGLASFPFPQMLAT